MKVFFRMFCSLIGLGLLVSLSGCSFHTPSFDEAKSKLETAGYIVVSMEGSEYLESDENQFQMLTSAELDKYLYASKGEDEIYLFFFFNTNQASSNYDFMNMNQLRSGQSNNLVYFGTKQAIKDLGV